MWCRGKSAQLPWFCLLTEDRLFLLLGLLSGKIRNVLTHHTALCAVSLPPPSSSGPFGRRLLKAGGSSSSGEAEKSRDARQNGRCVAGAVIAEGLRECRGIVNESD